MRKQEEIGECVRLLSPPGFEILSLIILTHLLSFARRFSPRQALFTRPAGSRPTDTSLRPWQSQQSKLVQRSAQQKARAAIALCSVA